MAETAVSATKVKGRACHVVIVVDPVQLTKNKENSGGVSEPAGRDQEMREAVELVIISSWMIVLLLSCSSTAAFPYSC